MFCNCNQESKVYKQPLWPNAQLAVQVFGLKLWPQSPGLGLWLWVRGLSLGFAQKLRARAQIATLHFEDHGSFGVARNAWVANACSLRECPAVALACTQKLNKHIYIYTYVYIYV